METLLLRTIRELGWIYEHKLAAKFGFTLPWIEIDNLITKGYVEEFIADPQLPVKAIRLIGGGIDRLTIIDSTPIVVPPPSPEQLRRIELVQKLKDDTITAIELRELLRMIILR